MVLIFCFPTEKSCSHKYVYGNGRLFSELYAQNQGDLSSKWFFMWRLCYSLATLMTANNWKPSDSDLERDLQLRPQCLLLRLRVGEEWPGLAFRAIPEAVGLRKSLSGSWGSETLPACCEAWTWPHWRCLSGRPNGHWVGSWSLDHISSHPLSPVVPYCLSSATVDHGLRSEWWCHSWLHLDNCSQSREWVLTNSHFVRLHQSKRAICT